MSGALAPQLHGESQPTISDPTPIVMRSAHHPIGALPDRRIASYWPCAVWFSVGAPESGLATLHPMHDPARCRTGRNAQKGQTVATIQAGFCGNKLFGWVNSGALSVNPF
jgi:hypothetical protein